MFEFWLLLHFEGEAGKNINSNNCKSRLKKYMPGYNKSIDHRKFRSEMVESAIKKAEKRDNPPCEDWPRKTGTTIYRLVKNMLADQQD